MSREVTGTAAPDLPVGAAGPAEPRAGSTAGGATGAPHRPTAPAAVVEAPGGRPRRRAVGVLVVAALTGAALGWNGAGSWRRAQEGELALASTVAGAAVVAVTGTGAAEPPATDGGTGAESGRGAPFEGRFATLVVRVTNFADVPLEVRGGGRGFSAVRVRFLDPSGVTLRPRRALTIGVAVEVTCGSPQPLEVPPIRVALPDGQFREVPLDAATPAIADLCAADARGAVPLVIGAASPARTNVAALVDNGRFRILVVAPSGRTTRILGVRIGGIELGADPLPMTVDGTPRAIWLDQPSRCERSVSGTGLPRTVDLEVDAGTGQTVPVRLDIGDPLARWLLDGPCGRTTPSGTAASGTAP